MREIPASEIEGFFADKHTGVHRYDTEDFLRLEAQEKLFHLGTGTHLLDFGCGTADLLAYYASAFDKAWGADLSDNMLAHARTRLATFGKANVTLLKADDASIWAQLSGVQLDAITTAAVLQYLTPPQIEAFVRAGTRQLGSDGRFVFFDVVDPNLYWLLKYNLYAPDKPMSANLGRAALTALKLAVKRIPRLARGRTYDFSAELGHAHLPGTLAAIADRAGLDCRIVRSMYYEYRYHAVLTRRADVS